jgi:hypothetical protein
VEDVAADVAPEALAVIAPTDAELEAVSRREFDANPACAQAGAEQLVAQRERAQTECDRVVIDEPVARAEAEVEAAAANPADHAGVGDVELEI